MAGDVAHASRAQEIKAAFDHWTGFLHKVICLMVRKGRSRQAHLQVGRLLLRAGPVVCGWFPVAVMPAALLGRHLGLPRRRQARCGQLTRARDCACVLKDLLIRLDFNAHYAARQ